MAEQKNKYSKKAKPSTRKKGWGSLRLSKQREISMKLQNKYVFPLRKPKKTVLTIIFRFL